MIFTTTDLCEYYEDEHGVIHQVNATPYTYDESYVDTYLSPEYRERSAALMGLRLGACLSAYSSVYNLRPTTILDVGYGDGSFLNLAKEIIAHPMGMDVTGLPVPEGCTKLEEYQYADVVTYWDVFEHIEDLSFIKDLLAQVVVMSMPNVEGKDFDVWKHRKPNEHLHHFTPESLTKLMDSYGWELLFVNHSEDTIRKGAFNNILTAAFKRKV